MDKVFFLTYFGFAVASPLPAVYGRRELLDARSPEAAATLTQGPGGTGSACLPGASGGFRDARLPSPRESSVVLSLFLFPNLFSSPSWFSAVCHRGKGVPSFWLVSRSLCPQVEDKGWSPSTCDTVVVRRGSLEKGDGVVFGDMASSFFRVPPSSPWRFDSHFPYFSASNLAIQVCTSVASCVARSVVNKTIRQSGENAAKTCLCTILTPLRCGPFSARL